MGYQARTSMAIYPLIEWKSTYHPLTIGHRLKSVDIGGPSINQPMGKRHVMCQNPDTLQFAAKSLVALDVRPLGPGSRTIRIRWTAPQLQLSFRPRALARPRIKPQLRFRSSQPKQTWNSMRKLIGNRWNPGCFNVNPIHRGIIHFRNQWKPGFL